MDKEANLLCTASVIWPLKTSHMTKAFCVEVSFSSFLLLTMYGLIISSISLSVSASFDQCFGFWLRENPFGNTKPRGKLALVLPP